MVVSGRHGREDVGPRPPIGRGLVESSRGERSKPISPQTSPLARATWPQALGLAGRWVGDKARAQGPGKGGKAYAMFNSAGPGT